VYQNLEKTATSVTSGNATVQKSKGAITRPTARDAGEREHDGGIAPCSFERGVTEKDMPFHNIIIGNYIWFIKIELKQMHCSYSRTKKIQNVFFMSYVIIFEGQH